MRTLTEALDRAQSLRDFKQSSPERFEKTVDYEDIVNLADELERIISGVAESMSRMESDSN